MSALRILHVDDEPDIREVVEISLGLDPEFSVRSCSSGSEAIAAAADWGPDLILLDVMMPDMDGPATLAQLRKTPQTSSIPVIFMTARAQTRELERFRALGAEGVISKPFDPLSLANFVRQKMQTPEFRFAGPRSRFLSRARKEVLSLLRYRDELSGQPDSSAPLEHIITIAHKLAGGGGTVGFPQISAAALAAEKVAIEMRGGTAATSKVEEAINSLIDIIQHA
jgi:CheY-like chemotaxis protein